MVHIAKCIVDIDANQITKPLSQSQNDLKTSPLPQPEKPLTWRMQQLDPPRKYQLFPRERRLPVLNSSDKAVDVEKAVPASSVSTSDKTDKQLASNSLKRLKQHSLVRRRKISVPEILPRTTVLELAMDSPTIPGRPPFHERSISAPGTSFRKHQLTEEGHRKDGSESSGIMDRGRPTKKPDFRTNCPIIQRTEPKRDKSSEQKAFEQLPTGLKQADASEQLEQSELALLQKQAFHQVGGFEVLKAADVETLSKELRHLDMRTEYLRHTYNALRVGRRNLHSRICQYLRSPRVAKFSHEWMMKQDEALAELDASIDDWVKKLEQAENRRTRVRQKLLEHVAAAACLAVGGLNTTPESPQQPQANTLASGIGNISTPPRSPLKETFTSASAASSSPSPQRVVGRVPSTVVEQPIIEEAATRETEERVMSTASLKRADFESIRIYAGNDVYAPGAPNVQTI